MAPKKVWSILSCIVVIRYMYLYVSRCVFFRCLWVTHPRGGCVRQGYLGVGLTVRVVVVMMTVMVAFPLRRFGRRC